MEKPQKPNDPLYPIALALLDLINRPALLRLEHPCHNHTLKLTGTLIRAFDPLEPTSAPTITLMTGAQSITLRLSEIQKATYRKSIPPFSHLESLHLLLKDGYGLHITPQPQTQTPNKPE